jgi:hypothetical protein
MIKAKNYSKCIIAMVVKLASGGSGMTKVYYLWKRILIKIEILGLIKKLLFLFMQ